MAPAYATAADLATWTGATAPVNAAQLLRRASALVRKATAVAFYATDTTGLPTDADTLQAFNDATCAQATFWAVNNIDPSGGALTQSGILTSKRLGSASLNYDAAGSGSVTAWQAKVAATSELCEEAFDILSAAGINLINPWIAG
jgi:hypothetical protein